MDFDELQRFLARLRDPRLEGIGRHRGHVFGALRILERELLDAGEDLFVIVRELSKFGLLVFEAHRLHDRSTGCCSNRRPDAHQRGSARRADLAQFVIGTLSLAELFVDLVELLLSDSRSVGRLCEFILSIDESLEMRTRRSKL